MTEHKSGISGNLDSIIDLGLENGRKSIIINGDPKGLRELANLLNNLADLDQDKIDELPTGASEHIHLVPNYHLSYSSEELIIGRLDGKGIGIRYDSFVPRK